MTTLHLISFGRLTGHELVFSQNNYLPYQQSFQKSTEISAQFFVWRRVVAVSGVVLCIFLGSEEEETVGIKSREEKESSPIVWKNM